MAVKRISSLLLVLLLFVQLAVPPKKADAFVFLIPFAAAGAASAGSAVASALGYLGAIAGTMYALDYMDDVFYGSNTDNFDERANKYIESKMRVQAEVDKAVASAPQAVKDSAQKALSDSIQAGNNKLVLDATLATWMQQTAQKTATASSLYADKASLPPSDMKSWDYGYPTAYYNKTLDPTALLSFGGSQFYLSTSKPTKGYSGSEKWYDASNVNSLYVIRKIGESLSTAIVTMRLTIGPGSIFGEDASRAWATNGGTALAVTESFTYGSSWGVSGTFTMRDDFKNALNSEQLRNLMKMTVAAAGYEVLHMSKAEFLSLSTADNQARLKMAQDVYGGTEIPLPSADYTVAGNPVYWNPTTADWVTPSGTVIPGEVKVALPDVVVGRTTVGGIAKPTTAVRTKAGDGIAVKTKERVDAGTGTQNPSIPGTPGLDWNSTPTDKIDFAPLMTAFGSFTTKFPFSIPWDIARQLSVFDVAPKSPVLKINKTIPVFSTEVKLKFDIDFGMFDGLMAFVRWAMLILWYIGIALSLRKLMPE